MTTATAFAKNWKAIAALPDVYLKLSVACTTDHLKLEKFRNGFPELFLEDGAEGQQQPIPLSLIRQVAEAVHSEGDHDRSCTDEELKEAIGLVSVECRYSVAWGKLPMPQVLEVAYDQFHQLCKENHGTLFPWILIEIPIQGKIYYLGWISDNGTNNDREGMDAIIYPAELIDINA